MKQKKCTKIEAHRVYGDPYPVPELWPSLSRSEFNAILDEALAAERRATVERIRAELGSVGAMEGTVDLVQRILDEEAAR